MAKVSPHSRSRAIQLLKDQVDAMGHEVNFARVAATQLYDGSFKGCLKRLVFGLCFRTELFSRSARHPERLVVVYSGRSRMREDHDYMVDSIVNIAGYEHVRVIEPRERLSILWSTRVLLRAWAFRRLGRTVTNSLLDRISVAVILAKYDICIETEVLGSLGQPPRVFTFCDAHPVDNAIAQIAKIRGIPTVTVQHGQYRILEGRNMSADAEAYLNFVSDKMLVWGEATVRELSRAGISQNRLVIAGWLREWPTRNDHSDYPDQADKPFGVMLNGANGSASNATLIQTAESISASIGKRYIVRLHPANSEKEYSQIPKSYCDVVRKMDLAEYAQETSFSLAHMTGGTIELLRMRRAVYLLDDGLLADVFRREGLSFLDSDEITHALAEDAANLENCEERMVEYYRYYNDDTDAEERIYSVLVGGI